MTRKRNRRRPKSRPDSTSDRPDAARSPSGPAMDLEYTLDFALDRAQVLCRQSSDYPNVYAFMLRVRRAENWQTVVSIDNNHPREGVPRHHLHRYTNGRKGPAQQLPFDVARPDDVNDAMDKALDWMIANWEELASRQCNETHKTTPLMRSAPRYAMAADTQIAFVSSPSRRTSPTRGWVSLCSKRSSRTIRWSFYSAPMAASCA